eukprot:106751-Hanusia_phi.AAC.1
MSRIEESNDAFLGQEELFRLISFFRSPIWVKCYMKWYKFKEQSKKIREVAGKVGLNTSQTLVAKVTRRISVGGLTGDPRHSKRSFTLSIGNARWRGLESLNVLQQDVCSRSGRISKKIE